MSNIKKRTVLIKKGKQTITYNFTFNEPSEEALNRYADKLREITDEMYLENIKKEG